VPHHVTGRAAEIQDAAGRSTPSLKSDRLHARRGLSNLSQNGNGSDRRPVAGVDPHAGAGAVKAILPSLNGPRHGESRLANVLNSNLPLHSPCS